MLLDIGPPFFGFDRDCPYSRRSPAFLANRSLCPSRFPAILLRAPRDLVRRWTERRAFWSVALDLDTPLPPVGEQVSLDIGPASIDGIPASAHQVRESRSGCSRLTRRLPTGLPIPRKCHPPASLLSLLSAAKYQLSLASSWSTLAPIIQQHRGKTYHAIAATLSSPVILATRICPHSDVST